MALRRWLAGLIALTLLRLVIAAVLPLIPDEAYYWIWSRHLQTGYFDHPPMVAVWIRAGTTLSYGALAAKLGSPRAMRAVGHANGSNPISVVVPCHRLIGADGSLVKYGGGLERKRWLLRHEGAAFNDAAAARETRAVERRFEGRNAA